MTQRTSELAVASDAHRQPVLQQLGGGAYAWIGVNGDSNAGVVDTGDGLVVIDAQQNERSGRMFRHRIEVELDRPTQYVVDTHYHLDHTAGNVAFSDVPIHAHARTHRLLDHCLGRAETGVWTLSETEIKLKLFFGANIRELVRPGDPIEDWFVARVQGEDYDVMHLRAPNVSLPDTSVLELPHDRLECTYWGPAHCDGDLILVLERQRVAFVGDLVFVGRFPWFGDCDLDGWIDRVTQLLKLDVAAVVPGHGPVVSLREVAVFRDLLVATRDTVAAAVAHGASEEAAVAAFDLPAYRHLPRYREWAAFNARATYRYLLQR